MYHVNVVRVHEVFLVKASIPLANRCYISWNDDKCHAAKVVNDYAKLGRPITLTQSYKHAFVFVFVGLCH
jgi:hypothetical protein